MEPAKGLLQKAAANKGMQPRRMQPAEGPELAGKKAGGGQSLVGEGRTAGSGADHAGQFTYLLEQL